MADDKKVDKGAAPADKPAGGGKKMILIIVLLLVVLVGGGGAAAFFFLSGHGSGGQGQQQAQTKKSDVPPVFAKLDTFVVNLSGGNGTLLQVDMQCELANADAQTQLTNYMPKVRSAVILLLSAKTADELSTPEGKLKLKKQVKEVINGSMDNGSGDELVKSVLFTSFIIQNS